MQSGHSHSPTNIQNARQDSALAVGKWLGTSSIKEQYREVLTAFSCSLQYEREAISSGKVRARTMVARGSGIAYVSTALSASRCDLERCLGVFYRGSLG